MHHGRLGTGLVETLLGSRPVGLGLRPLKVLQKVGWAYNGPEIRGNWANGKKTAQWALDPQNINYKWNKNNDEQ